MPCVSRSPSHKFVTRCSASADVDALALEGDIRSFLQQLAEQGLIEIGA